MTTAAVESFSFSPFHGTAWKATKTTLVATTVVATCTLASVASAGTVTSDPRCAGYTCPLDNSAHDPFPCETAGNCQQCLTGPVWESRIAELNGKPLSGLRPTDFHVWTTDWASHVVLQSIVLTLLREVLGYRPKEAFVPNDGSMEVICCTETLLHFESWPSGRFPSDDGYFSLASLPNGYSGGSSFFVPGYTVEAFPLATSYNAYKYLPEYGNIFPRGMSTNCTELLLDPALGCVEGNYVCDTNIWTNTTCRQGRYIPPQCEADPTSCQEILMADPLYDKGRFEALIKNTGLKFTLAYAGAVRMPQLVAEKVSRGEHVIFYWWEPDPLPASMRAQPVNFPPNTLECEQAHNSGGGDPTLSDFDCAYPTAQLMKLGRRVDLLRDPALKHFFDSVQITSNEMNTMLTQHPAAGGTAPPFNISCDWIQNNFDRWQSWITPLDDGPSNVPPADTTTLAAAIAAPVATIAAAVLVAAVVYALRFAARPNRYAPTEAHRPLAVAYLALRGFAEMHEADPERTRVYREFSDLVRRTARRSECHVAQKVGDFFVVVSDSAVRLADFIDAASAAFDKHGFSAEMNDNTLHSVVDQVHDDSSASVVSIQSSSSTQQAHPGSALKSALSKKDKTKKKKSASAAVVKEADEDEAPKKKDSARRASATQRRKVTFRTTTLHGHLTVALHVGKFLIDFDDLTDTYEYRGQPLATCAALLDACADGQFLATDEFQEALMDGLNADCGLRLTVAGRRVERAAGPAIECLQYNVGGEVKHFEAAAPNAALESAVAAAEQATGLLARKRVTVAVVRFEELQAVAGRSGDAVTAANNALFERLTELVRLHRGHLHAAVGDLVVVSFNAARPTSEQARRGLRFCHDMVDAMEAISGLPRARLSDGPIALEHCPRVSCGIAVGEMFAGHSPDGSVAVIGSLVQEALELEAVCRSLPGIDVTVANEAEFEQLALLQWVGLLPATEAADAPSSFPRRGAISASNPMESSFDESFGAERSDTYSVTEQRDAQRCAINDAFRGFAETGDFASVLGAFATAAGAADDEEPATQKQSAEALLWTPQEEGGMAGERTEHTVAREQLWKVAKLQQLLESAETEMRQVQRDTRGGGDHGEPGTEGDAPSFVLVLPSASA